MKHWLDRQASNLVAAFVYGCFGVFVWWLGTSHAKGAELEWNPVSGATSYNIYLGLSGSYSLIGSTEDTSYGFPPSSGLVDAVVTVVNSTGLQSSPSCKIPVVGNAEGWVTISAPVVTGSQVALRVASNMPSVRVWKSFDLRSWKLLLLATANNVIFDSFTNGCVFYRATD